MEQYRPYVHHHGLCKAVMPDLLPVQVLGLEVFASGETAVELCGAPADGRDRPDGVHSKPLTGISSRAWLRPTSQAG